MMPYESVTPKVAHLPNMHLDSNKISTFELKVEDQKDTCESNSFKQMKLELSAEIKDTDRSREVCTTSYYKKAEVPALDSLSSESCEDKCDFSSNIMNTNVPMFSNADLKSCNFPQHSLCLKKTVLELKEYSLKELQQALEDLTSTIESVSGELVQLLLENDSLQQETDARNVAIEQLLKMTVKNSEMEPKPIQMSVILPSNCVDESSEDES